jgi:organic hydroperoxide reductase OsmC/OhrA
MPIEEHHYEVRVHWTGNLGEGTSHYRAYSRNHTVEVSGKPPIPCSSDPAFRGDRTRYNPEELLVAALSTCHMLWYLHLCAVNKIVVLNYVDEASGWMKEREDGGGEFTRVLLRPKVTVKKGADLQLAEKLHREAHCLCFIANSVRFPVGHEPVLAEADA